MWLGDRSTRQSRVHERTRLRADLSVFGTWTSARPRSTLRGARCGPRSTTARSGAARVPPRRSAALARTRAARPGASPRHEPPSSVRSPSCSSRLLPAPSPVVDHIVLHEHQGRRTAWCAISDLGSGRERHTGQPLTLHQWTAPGPSSPKPKRGNPALVRRGDDLGGQQRKHEEVGGACSGLVTGLVSSPYVRGLGECIVDKPGQQRHPDLQDHRHNFVTATGKTAVLARPGDGLTMTLHPSYTSPGSGTGPTVGA